MRELTRMTQDDGPIRNIDRYLGARAYEKIAGERFAERVALTDEALTEIQMRLIKMRGMAIRSSGAALSDEERAVCQMEVDYLKEEIDVLASAISEVNGEEFDAADRDPALTEAEMDRALARAAEILDELYGRSGFDDAKAPQTADDSGEGPRRGLPGLDDDEVSDWMKSLM
jgi:hypothetical protein